jgi:hypothetical protein
MLAGADSIDDLDVLRAGATPVLFDDLRHRPRSGRGCEGSSGPTCASLTPSAGPS